MSAGASRTLTAVATVLVVVATVDGFAVGDGTGWVALAGLVAITAGWVVLWRAPASPVGPALAWSSGAIALEMLGERVVPPAAVGLWPVNLAGIFSLLLVFPDGRSHGRLWRTLPWVYAAATAGAIFSGWGTKQVGGKIVGETSTSQVAVGIVAMPTIGICLVLAVACVVLRYRRGAEREREQIRWMMLAGAVTVVLLVGGWVALSQGASIPVAFGPFLVAIVALVPAAVGVAIVRHDLFDVDRLLGQSTWLVTLLASAALFGVVVLVHSGFVSRYTGVVGSAAAFVTALVLLPLHRFVNGFVGRLVDRDRYVIVERFAADVRAGRREPEEVERVLC